LTERGFASLARKLSNEEIAWEVSGQFGEIALPMDLEIGQSLSDAPPGVHW
jgi:hypothetical protein